MGGSSQPPATITTTQNAASEPWAPSQGLLTSNLGEAQYLYNADIGYKPWTGPTQTPLSQQSVDALNQTETLARQGSPMLGQAAQTGQGLLSTYGNIAQGGELGQTNPHLQTMLDNNASRISDKVNSAASASGRYGSGMHTDVLTRGIAETNTPLLVQDYENQRARQFQAAGVAGQMAQLAPSLYSNQFLPAQQLAGVGDFLTQRSQNQLNADMERWNAAEARPWEQLARANAIAAGAGQLGGTRSATGTAPNLNQGPSTAQKAIGGALAGYGVAGPVGAVGGGLLGFL